MADKKDTTAILVRHYRLKELRELGNRTKRILAYIDSFSDLTRVEKAKIYEDTCLQTKGYAPKTNPWR